MLHKSNGGKVLASMGDALDERGGVGVGGQPQDVEECGLGREVERDEGLMYYSAAATAIEGRKRMGAGMIVEGEYGKRKDEGR